MYSYTYDPDTGGLLLNSTPTGFSREPRPVYAAELDLFGFDAHWSYERQNEAPYLWAEANIYYYRNRKVAMLKGGDLYQAPELVLLESPEPGGAALRPVDIPAMCARNVEFLQIIEQATVKRIIAVYEKYKDKLDIFHVAYSGGKDSAVLLDLVAKALPKDSFVVVFGDTGMEFPDTYRAVDETERRCEEQGISFYRAKSHLPPQESWKLFGPPSRVLRWCCSVHKSTPQTLMLREITGKTSLVGMDFVGVRAQESLRRSEYDEENYGKKQRGQFSHNAILDWSSAEIWLYVYISRLPINQAYIKGNARAGCIFCPMSSGISDYVRKYNYPSQIGGYLSYIKSVYGEKSAKTYVANGGWCARRNGRELKDNPSRCTEKSTNGILEIHVETPATDWREWIKTIGQLKGSAPQYAIVAEGHTYDFSVRGDQGSYVVCIQETLLANDPLFGRRFKQVFRKAAYCVACKVCQVNCRRGNIFFDSNGKVSLSLCAHCGDCHEIDSGCLAFHSLRHPNGGGTSMKSLNSFADHAPKPEWLRSFFELKEQFFKEHSLGPMMYDMFRRFLKDAGLIAKNQCTPLVELVVRLNWESEAVWGILLTNLATENPQIQWYIKSLEVGRCCSPQVFEDRLLLEEVKPKDAKSIRKAFNRLALTPLGTALHFGQVDDEGNLMRTKCVVSDARVILYALYTFAEQCNGFWEFSLTRLLQHDMDQDGISPTEIFGLTREDMQPLLLGLAAKYPAFIGATFTHGLDKITLNNQKTSADVLGLF